MGQQRYEYEIQAAMRRVAGPEWAFNVITVSSARSSDRGAKRVPIRLHNVAPLWLSRATGRVLYGTSDLVHRFDLRLPAAWGREVATVHDLPPLRFPDEGTLTASAAASARRANRIIVPSQFAAEEVAELIGVDDAVVIPNGVGKDYADSIPATDDQLRRLGIDVPFVMHAAGASQRKNLSGLADAWRLLEPDHPELSLVLCGPTDPRRDAAFQGLARVVTTGRLDPAELGGLMRRACVLIVPSTYEGFGLPALEGMMCGTPVLAARRGALPEVCGNAALLTEPDGEAIANGVNRLLEDRILVERLRKAGPLRAAQYQWDRAAREHLRVYRDALN
jgi:alpha-1,3-rhamnosyl/mannosyltransferase